MIKAAIKFSDGSYWYNYTQRGFEIRKAWTFNKATRADEHAHKIGLTDFKIVPVELKFDPTTVEELA